MNYPAAVATHLHTNRTTGLPFELAWAEAMRALPMPVWFHQGDEPEMRNFLRNHMRAAYNRDGSSRGRLSVNLEALV